VTANASSSSAGSPAETAGRLRVELPGSGLLPPLPDAFLAGRDRDLLAPLILAEPGALPELPPAAGTDRRDLAAALAAANHGYGHPRADELAARLADPATRVVVAGQQPGLFGGPLYTFSKMLAVSRWAAELSAAGQPAVGVFWVATEDHDWHEVSRASVLTHQGPLEVDLGDDPEPLTPVGMRTLGPGVAAALERLRAAAHGERYDEWLDRVAAWYRPDARFGEAFCRLMIDLLGEHAPLLMDAMLPAVKVAERPWLARLVERREAAEAAFAGADERVTERGYELQVHPQRGVSPLFVYQGGERRRVAWSADGGSWELRGAGGGPRPLAALVETIAENPVAVSPGVLARPVIQDAILGSSLFLLGPGELSYMPQVAPLYEVLGVRPPALALRPQVLVLESHQVDKLADAGLTLAELLAPRDELERVLAEGGDGAFAAEPRRRIEAALESLRGPALALDPNLERPLGKTRDLVERALDTFDGKVRAAAARRDEVRLGRVEKLRDAVLPHGKLQERVVCSAHYRGKHIELTASYWEQMRLDGAVLQVVTP
jgi:bacillithiol synthase